MDAADDFVVAMTYPIHATTPRIPPTIISAESCKMIGLHSDSIRRYAYRKKATIHSIKMAMPVPFRLSMARKFLLVIYWF